MGELIKLESATEQWREYIAKELEAAAKLVRNSESRAVAVAVGVVFVEEDGRRSVYSSIEGSDMVTLAAGCYRLANRCWSLLEAESVPPEEFEDGDEE